MMRHSFPPEKMFAVFLLVLLCAGVMLLFRMDLTLNGRALTSPRPAPTPEGLVGVEPDVREGTLGHRGGENCFFFHSRDTLKCFFLFLCL